MTFFKKQNTQTIYQLQLFILNKKCFRAKRIQTLSCNIGETLV